MRYTLFGILFLLSILLLAGCSDDASRPQPTGNDPTVSGEIGDGDFEFEIGGGEPGDPFTGPFLLRGSNLHYDDDAGALVVDLTVRNLGSYPHREPIGLTFIRLDPDEVTVLNPDNGVHGDGAAIVFQFANDDAVWTPGEASLPRTVQFGVARGTSIAFVARLDLGAPIEGGTIAGRVWNDADENGVMDDGEAGIPYQPIYLYSFSDEEDSTVTREFAYAETDADGRYAFHHLRAGAYVVDRGLVTNDCRPTTPNQIHVLLVEVDGDVSSYRNANFGCVPLVHPPLLGQRVRITGKFYEPETFVAFTVEPLPCDSIPPDAMIPPDPDCVGGTLRGTVVEVRDARGLPNVRIFTTWFLVDPIRFPQPPQVGQRIEARVDRNEWLFAYMITDWHGAHDELVGIVDMAETGPDGVVRIRVLGTWIALPNIIVGDN